MDVFQSIKLILCLNHSIEAAFCHCIVGATEEPEVIPDPAKQTDRVVKIAGISAGVLVFILLVLVAILLVKKR